MPTLTTTSLFEIEVGGETVRFSGARTRLVGGRKYDVLATIEDDGGSDTLWTSGVHRFDWAAIIVDPNNLYADNDPAAKVTIELSSASYSTAVEVRRESPLVLTSNMLGPDSDVALSEPITRIGAVNHNADGDGDVEVRTLLFSAAVPA